MIYRKVRFHREIRLTENRLCRSIEISINRTRILDLTFFIFEFLLQIFHVILHFLHFLQFFFSLQQWLQLEHEALPWPVLQDLILSPVVLHDKSGITFSSNLQEFWTRHIASHFCLKHGQNIVDFVITKIFKHTNHTSLKKNFRHRFTENFGLSR